MVTKSSLVQPPRLAVWLVDLFTPIGQAESIPGDLLEEFSEIYSKSGVVSARRWYWRQSVKSVAHLTASGFLMAPWLIAVAVVGGWLLAWGFYWLTEKAIIAIHYKYQVYAHIDAYVFWLLYGVLIERLVEPLLVGTIVALAVKGREMVVTKNAHKAQNQLFQADLRQKGFSLLHLVILILRAFVFFEVPSRFLLRTKGNV